VKLQVWRNQSIFQRFGKKNEYYSDYEDGYFVVTVTNISAFVADDKLIQDIYQQLHNAGKLILISKMRSVKVSKK